jgi:hypothetical protein
MIFEMPQQRAFPKHQDAVEKAVPHLRRAVPAVF